MKKFLLIALILLFPCLAKADPLSPEPMVVKLSDSKTANDAPALTLMDPPEVKSWFDKIPSLQNVVVWDFKDNRVDYLAMVEAVTYKGFSLNIGYSPAKAAVVALSYDLLNLKDLGVNVPILDLVTIKPVIGYGFDRIDLRDMEDTREKVFAGVSLINFKFY